ncbi:hypothetical protein MTR67_012974 [Solanum verrucosum]|uniref:Integrase zinc-binding domain-containing protein n=1 Tax=Solanum verrucosum TaxID=315347 RepID=A0AAF0Q9L7_SOLVR|nr:hypothetical protein MTR67_012974 [Solanum verrucosum]
MLKKFIEAFSQGGVGRLCVTNVDDLREHILSETHSSRYFIHPEDTKIYRDFREVYWWNDMKRDIVEFVTKFSNCQQVKVEHKKIGGLSYDISFLLGSGKI